ncbi:hypothetical protein [Glycomyces sp. NPDC048151]|uniref:hypothetical protein n=1 Tax=Glycomyces sp. NPDC048151 TaxID=3364002 RepID=UPI00371117B0
MTAGIRRALTVALAALTSAVGAVAVAAPAQAAVPYTCSVYGYTNGRTVIADNEGVGQAGGAHVYADICWAPRGDGYYNTLVVWDVQDTLADGSGATIRMEWTGTDGDVHYDVPPANQRAWTYLSTAEGSWQRNNIKGLYIRACLTNTNSEGHHCGTKA